MVAMQTFPFIIVAVFSAFAVLAHAFQDNLLQRIGLSLLNAGSVLTVFVILRGHPETAGTHILIGYGLAFYSVGTAVKFRRYHFVAKRIDDDTDTCRVESGTH